MSHDHHEEIKQTFWTWLEDLNFRKKSVFFIFYKVTFIVFEIT